MKEKSFRNDSKIIYLFLKRKFNVDYSLVFIQKKIQRIQKNIPTSMYLNKSMKYLVKNLQKNLQKSCKKLVKQIIKKYVKYEINYPKNQMYEVVEFYERSEKSVRAISNPRNSTCKGAVSLKIPGLFLYSLLRFVI